MSWVVSQVSPGAIVSCDQKMCAALAKARFPRDQLQVLGLSSGTPLTSQVIVETPDIRQIFGTRLTAEYAPTVLTIEGSGPQEVVIGAVAPNGATAYQHDLATDRASRKQNGIALLDNSRIAISAKAHAQLVAGDVDSRVLVAVDALAIAGPVYLVDFGNVATSETPDIPYRYVDVALRDPASQVSGSAYLKELRNALNSGLQGTYRPLRTQTLTVPGQGAVLRVLFGAPTPFDLIQSGG